MFVKYIVCTGPRPRELKLRNEMSTHAHTGKCHQMMMRTSFFLLEMSTTTNPIIAITPSVMTMYMNAVTAPACRFVDL